MHKYDMKFIPNPAEYRAELSPEELSHPKLQLIHCSGENPMETRTNGGVREVIIIEFYLFIILNILFSFWPTSN